ncbi:MAG: glycosyltransferase family 9 protein [Fusobacteriaceae bacterium]
MIRKLNRIIQDFLRPLRLNIGKYIWDRKKNSFEELIENDKIKMNGVKSILFLRYDGKIGDMVINTFVFREIKKMYPNIKIGVVARGTAKDIIKNNKNIDKIYNYEKGLEKELGKQISKENYDVLVDFSEMLRVNQMKFINLCSAKINIGLNKEEWNLFRLSFSKNEKEHITELYNNLLKKIGIKTENFNYEIILSKENLEAVQNIVSKNEYLVLNPYAASKHRSLNKYKIIEVAKLLLENKKGDLYIIGESSKKEEILEICKSLGSRVKYPELKGILDVAAFISKASYVVSPDTSIVHIAAAFKIPMTAIYRADNLENTNSKLWAPNYSEAKQIFSIDQNKKIGEETDINLFKVEEIKEW